LQLLKARAPARIEDDGLAVEHCGPARKARRRFRDRAEARRPIVAAAREEGDMAVVDPAEEPIAVELRLVQPVEALGRPRDRGRELRPRALGQRRAFRPFGVLEVARLFAARPLGGRTPRVLLAAVAAFDQQPVVLLLALAGPLGHPHERPAAGEASALELAVELALREPLGRVA